MTSDIYGRLLIYKISVGVYVEDLQCKNCLINEEEHMEGFFGKIDEQS